MFIIVNKGGLTTNIIMVALSLTFSKFSFEIREYMITNCAWLIAPFDKKLWENETMYLSYLPLNIQAQVNNKFRIVFYYCLFFSLI